jgi:hypothetical protein
MVVGGGQLFWADSQGTIYRAPTSGGDVAVVSTEGGRVTGIAVDSGALFWTNRYNNTVRTASVPSGVPSTLLVTIGGPFRVAVWGPESTLYVGKVDSGQLVRLPTVGGAEEFVAAAEHVHSVASDADSVVWALDTVGEVHKLDKGSGAVTTLATGQATPATIVIANGYAYWSNYGGTDDAVARIPLQGGTPEPFAQGKNVAWIGTDGQDIFFSSEDTIWRVPTSGGPRFALADDPGPSGDPAAFAVDDTWLYIYHGPQGVIFKVAK